jgi:malate dehydrogenase
MAPVRDAIMAIILVIFGMSSDFTLAGMRPQWETGLKAFTIANNAMRSRRGRAAPRLFLDHRPERPMMTWQVYIHLFSMSCRGGRTMSRVKIGVVGAGQVGGTTAQRIAEHGIGDVVLVDIVEGLPQGKALDLMESRPEQHSDCEIRGSNNYADLKGCAIVVITAGIARKPGMTREQLQETNAGIVKGACEAIVRNGDSPIVITVTNPLDVMTYLACKVTKFDRHRVFGMAGVLDSSRMAYFIAEKLRVSVKDVSAMVLGGHGDMMVPLPRYTTVSGIPLPELLPAEEIEKINKRTQDGGIEIVNLLKQGSAFYAPASSVAAMVGSIVNDEKRILPCCAFLDGEYGFTDVCLGVPVKLGAGGIEQILTLTLTEAEQAAMKKNAEAVRKNCGLLKY